MVGGYWMYGGSQQQREPHTPDHNRVMTTSQVVIPTVAPSFGIWPYTPPTPSIRDEHRGAYYLSPSAIAGLNVEDSASNNITLGTGWD